MSKWVCKVCGYVYDEEKQGVPFENLPDNWVCPLCGAAKSSFYRKDLEPAKAAPVKIHMDEDMKQLSPGELSAVCSNLARGCEKQYKERESTLFKELAEFFERATPAPSDGSLDKLIELIEKDLNQGYPALNYEAKEQKDRGTQRICVWGEKVTAILDSLLKRYRSEGEAFLQNTQVWVCSVCGFIYVGDNPPQICPVCKVPSWKFDKVEGRDK